MNLRNDGSSLYGIISSKEIKVMMIHVWQIIVYIERTIIPESIENERVREKTQCQHIEFKVFTLTFVNLLTSHRTEKILSRLEQMMENQIIEVLKFLVTTTFFETMLHLNSLPQILK
jgi:hypothetical protein